MATHTLRTSWHLTCTCTFLLLGTHAQALETRRAATVVDEDTKTSGYVDLLFTSAYVFRGINYSEDLLEPNLQPTLAYAVDPPGTGSFVASLWAYIPFDDEGPEVYPTFSYKAGNRWVGVEAGYSMFATVKPFEPYNHVFYLYFNPLDGLAVHPTSGVAVDPVLNYVYYAFAGGVVQLSSDTLTANLRVTSGIQKQAGESFRMNDVSGRLSLTNTLSDFAYITFVLGLGYDDRKDVINPWLGIAPGYTF